MLGRALGQAGGEILAHRRFGECSEHKRRAWAHRAVLFGFLGLLVLSGVVALREALGLPYPLPAGDPLKVLGNVCAALLIGGVSFYVIVHAVEAGRREASSFFNWLFPVNVLLAALTGVAAEAVRLGDARAAAYPVYFVHLVFVFALFAMLPYTKLAHAGYRLLAVAGQRYESLLAERETRRPREAAPDPERGARRGRPRGAARPRPDGARRLLGRRARRRLLPAPRRGGAARAGTVLPERQAAVRHRVRAREGPARGQGPGRPAGQVGRADVVRGCRRAAVHVVGREPPARAATP